MSDEEGKITEGTEPKAAGNETFRPPWPVRNKPPVRVVDKPPTRAGDKRPVTPFDLPPDPIGDPQRRRIIAEDAAETVSGETVTAAPDGAIEKASDELLEMLGITRDKGGRGV